MYGVETSKPQSATNDLSAGPVSEPGALAIFQAVLNYLANSSSSRDYPLPSPKIHWQHMRWYSFDLAVLRESTGLVLTYCTLRKTNNYATLFFLEGDLARFRLLIPLNYNIISFLTRDIQRDCTTARTEPNHKYSRFWVHR